MKGLIKVILRALFEIGKEIWDDYRQDQLYQEALRENEEHDRAERLRKSESKTHEEIRRVKEAHDPSPAGDAEWLLNRDPETR